MDKINQFIENNIKKIILVFLFLNPILDVTTGLLTNDIHVSFSLSSPVRLIFMLFCIYYIFKLDKTDNVNNNKLYIKIFGIYLVLFIVTVLIFKGFNPLFFEVKNTLNTFYFPIVLIALLDMFSQYKVKLNIKHIAILYTIYLLLVLVPTILGIGFNSYYHSKEGSVGWFISANAVGNILSIFMPFIAYYLINYREAKLMNIVLLLMILIVSLGIGTKVPVLSLLIVILLHLIYFIKKWNKENKYNYILGTLVICVIFIGVSSYVVTKTSFYKNIQIHKNYLGINHYYEVFTDYELIDHFIFSQRLTFLYNTSKNYKKASILEKINGIGYIENYGTDEESDKTIEIDYFEVFFRNGILGFLVFIAPLFNIVKLSLRKIREKSLINFEFKMSYLLMVLLGLFSGHIFVTPAVSIFVALIIVMTFAHDKFENTINDNDLSN